MYLILNILIMRPPKLNVNYYLTHFEKFPPTHKLLPEYRKAFLKKKLKGASDKQIKFAEKIAWLGLSSISYKKYKNIISLALSVLEEINDASDWIKYFVDKNKKIKTGERFHDALVVYIMDSYRNDYN